MYFKGLLVSQYLVPITSLVLFIFCAFMYVTFLKLKGLGLGNWWRKNFYIESSKSTSALLLGGLPFSLTILMGTSFVAYNNLDTFPLSTHIAFVVSMIMIMLYGYLDDVYELRSLVKFCAQVIVLSIFSLVAANNLMVAESSFAFIVIFMVGLACVNGANFLDGLDGMSVKIGLSALGAFSFISYWSGNIGLGSMVIVMTSPFLAFYLFNKNHQKSI